MCDSYYYQVDLIFMLASLVVINHLILISIYVFCIILMLIKTIAQFWKWFILLFRGAILS
jgi:hypothetical protein